MLKRTLIVIVIIATAIFVPYYTNYYLGNPEQRAHYIICWGVGAITLFVIGLIISFIISLIKMAFNYIKNG